MEITTSTHTPLDTHTLLQETPLPGGTRTGWESRGLGTVAIAQSHRLGALSLQAEQLHISAAFSIMAEKEISWETKYIMKAPSVQPERSSGDRTSTR